MKNRNSSKGDAKRLAARRGSEKLHVPTVRPPSERMLTLDASPEILSHAVVEEASTREAFQQARTYFDALRGMAGGMAALAVIFGAELERLHKLYGIQRGGDRRSDQTRMLSGLKWSDLVKRELGISDDTARNYMNLSREARERLPAIRELAETLLTTPLGSMPELKRAALLEKTRSLLPSDSANQLMLDWGIAKKPALRGGHRSGPEKLTSAQQQEAFERACRENFERVCMSLDQFIAGGEWKLRGDAELELLIATAEHAAKSVSAWLKVPAGRRTRPDAERLFSEPHEPANPKR
jgi:hypothetical protein